ncbi:MAG: hypothetical protein CVV47_01485 [Spirochaetae bacterium HGW-Spirochaetae-3]|jgi:hypothetical protein|nr:MAG: hypothetical protein CVV47_01485 [Spirochaetae bacterium HGW-Spirochaetae-3]
MRGDAANLARSMLVRLSVASAFMSLVGLSMYVAGNFSLLSGDALSAVTFATGSAGIAAILFSCAGLAVIFAAPTVGGKLSGASVGVSAASGAIGLAALVFAGLVRALSGGLSF